MTQHGSAALHDDPVTTMVARIGVADTEPVFREGVKALVQGGSADMQVTGQAANRSGTFEMVRHTQPDLVLLDSRLAPETNLFERLLRIRRDLRIVVIVRSYDQHVRYLHACLAAGVTGLLPRTVDPGELVQAIRLSHRAVKYYSPALPALLAGDQRQLTGTPDRTLTTHELQVLLLLADGNGNAEIAESLDVSVEAIRSRVKRILRKMSARDRTHAVALAYRTGLLTTSRQDLDSQ